MDVVCGLSQCSESTRSGRMFQRLDVLCLAYGATRGVNWMLPFHPAIQSWVASQFSAPSPCQLEAWPRIQTGANVLIAAPTGSGKTLAAFLCAIDALVKEAVAGSLEDAVRVLYVSPLRALSHDVHENLERPLAGINAALAGTPAEDFPIRAAVRTGDTPAVARAAMRRHPPHVLVTTPESLYVLLTSESGRATLASVRTVIVDEIHALMGTKRGAHLALTLERLTEVCGRPPQRIGLSATQQPITRVADFLCGESAAAAACQIVDLGHARTLDLALVLPSQPLEAVMAAEQQSEIYDTIAELIAAHRATLVFVNTRRLAERVSRALAERLAAMDGATEGQQDATDEGLASAHSQPFTVNPLIATPPRVLAHHGSLSRAQRLVAERMFKDGQLDALVATASLELGIDVGAVDLVVQMGSPRAVSTLLQRVGRACHQIGGIPKGRLFPQTRDDLVECAALLDMVARGELDALPPTPAARDVLAQQIVAEVAMQDCSEDALYAWVTRAAPYSHLERVEFDAILSMLGEGFATRFGRRAAYLHRDRVNARLRARPGARLLAITCGGAIPDAGDYDVICEPEGKVIGTVNEDFAIDSVPGNVFQLGTRNWRVLRVEQQSMRVADAGGAPPNMPFWFGESPGRSDAVSAAVSRLREQCGQAFDAGQAVSELSQKILQIPGVGTLAAGQIVDYLAAAHAMLGGLPTRSHLILERFFDEAGGMQLVLHAPLGVRINRAFGLGLRKRFCKQFNFELQAAATDDAVVISLGAVHSFALDTVWDYLHPNSVSQVVAQAVLDAPMFPIRWRWVTTCALAVPRFRSGRKVPPQIQRMAAEDLVALVFPDQIACQENISGPREIPKHPLVDQVIEDCLEEAMDIHGLIATLKDVRDGQRTTRTCDLTEPSPLAAEILAANPYAYLDDAPLEERRTRAVRTRRTRRSAEFEGAQPVGQIEPEAVALVDAALRPRLGGAEALHDALVSFGFLLPSEVVSSAAGDVTQAPITNATPDPSTPSRALFPELALDGPVDGPIAELLATGRVCRIGLPGGGLAWVASERMAEAMAVYGENCRTLGDAPPAHLQVFDGDRSAALVALVCSRLELLGIVEAATLAAQFELAETEIAVALNAVEQSGFALQLNYLGRDCWCERRILARISRTSTRVRRGQPQTVPHAAWMCWLLEQHGLTNPDHPPGLATTLTQLAGLPLMQEPLVKRILPARGIELDAAGVPGETLDSLTLSGEWLWFAMPRTKALEHGWKPSAAFDVVFLPAEQMAVWGPELDVLLCRRRPPRAVLGAASETLLAHLEVHGPSFMRTFTPTGLGPSELLSGLREGVAAGYLRADGFALLRELGFAGDASKSQGPTSRGPMSQGAAGTQGRGMASRAGRISCVQSAPRTFMGTSTDFDRQKQHVQSLLDRWGVVCRALVADEPLLPDWSTLRRTLRAMELSGDLVGGRFVELPDHEQYTRPETPAELIRHANQYAPACAPSPGMATGVHAATASADVPLVVLSALDPVFLALCLNGTTKISRRAQNFVILRAGECVAAREGTSVQVFRSLGESAMREVRAMLLRASA